MEIITSPKQMPRKEWLNLVKTRHARNKIKHALNEQNREVCRKRGSEMLEKEFRSHGLNLNRMMREGILKKEKRILKDPKPQIAVAELADSSVNFIFRPWVKRVDYLPVYYSLLEEVKKRFDKEGISIPYPQSDVHIHNHKE